MRAAVEEIIERMGRERSDSREHVFELETGPLEGERLALSGRVLEAGDLEALCAALAERLPGQQVDTSAVSVLRGPQAAWMHVSANLSSMHAEQSFNSELLGGLLYGWELQMLEQRGRWGYARLENGYLGWTYLPYLSAEELPEATHMVRVPASLLYDVPGKETHPTGRIFAGSRVRLLEERDGWACVQTYRNGWVRASDLRALGDQPGNVGQLRAQMVADAVQLVGAPYLWGGATVGGIDCSGLAQLVHGLAGIEIRRDADMQKVDGRPVEPPFQIGDLVFFSETGDRATHVAVSLGGWDIIHSSRARNGVYFDNIEAVEHLRRDFIGGASYLPE